MAFTSRMSVVHPEVPKRCGCGLRTYVVDRLPEVACVDHCRCAVVMDLTSPLEMLASVCPVVPVVCRDLLKPCRVEISSHRRIKTETPLQVVIGVEHYRAKSDHIVQTLEDWPPGVKRRAGIAGAASFVLAIIHRRNDLENLPADRIDRKLHRWNS